MNESNVIASKDRLHVRVTWIVFLVSLLLYLVGMLFPNLRVWGVGQWAHFPWYFYVSAVVLSVLIIVVVTRWVVHSRSSFQNKSQTNTYLYFGLIVFALALAAFYLLRVRLHFLGDGYTLLANIALDNPIVKSRNLGETLIHGWVYSLLSGEASARALLAYQLVSYAGGVVFILTVLLSTRKLFANTRDRVLFSLGMFSGGYMLLFFGYTEHYSLFVPSVAVFGMIGLLIVRGHLSRWYILPSLILSVFLHIFGVTLIPAALYVLLVDSVAGRRLKKQGRAVKTALAGTILVAGVILFGYFYSTNYFFRFAFVPLLPDRFTLEGYTLFSTTHLVDILNLSVLLFPGLPGVIVLLFFIPARKIAKLREMIFLLILLMSILAAISIFDPKLGMARDWDLFSFFGIPLVLAGYYFLMRGREYFGQASSVAVTVIAVGFFALIPRVVSQTFTKTGLAQIYDYARLDLKRSFFLLQQLHEYYWEQGQYERSPLLTFDFSGTFPEYDLTTKGADLRQQGRFEEAAVLFREAIRQNPIFAPAYCNLGSAYLELGNYDSAIGTMKIALGLSPHRIYTLYDLGRAYACENNPKDAEDCFRRALSVDPDYMPAGLALLDIYADAGTEEEYRRLLIELAANEQAPASVHRLLGEYYRSIDASDKAEEQFRMATVKSHDSSGVGMPPADGD